MPQALVLLLVLPSLLMPPRMCICQFASLGIGAAESRSASPDRPLMLAHSDNHRTECACESCRTRAAAAFQEGHNGQPSRRPADAPADPGPAKHWPGCPAAAGVGPLKMILPAVTALDDAATTTFCTPNAVTAVSTVRAAPVTSRAVLPALFISHCSLLI